MQHLKRHLLLYTILPLIVLMVATSYYRFMVIQDYIVGYEGECDPYESSCYVYCEDDDCTEPFYYSWIERNAGTLHALCGPLVTECDEAYECTDDPSCSISFCDSSIDECDELTELDRPLDEISETEL